MVFSRMEAKYRTNKSHIILCLIGGMCCLLPLYFDPVSNLEETRLRQAVSSSKNRESSIAILVLVVPIFMEILTDSVISLVNQGNTSKDAYLSALLNHCERFIFFIGSVIVPFTAFFPSNTTKWAYLYLCLSKCQLALVGGAVVISLCRYNERYWSARSTFLYLILLGTGSVLGAFTENITKDTDTLSKVHLRSASYFMIIAATGMFYLNCARWLYAMTSKIFNEYIWMKKTTTIKLNCDSTDENLIFPLVYILTSIISSSSNIAIAVAYPGIGNLNDDALFYHNFASIFFLFFLTYISTRMVKNEVVRGLNALIETKKMYVRYISHELRTPLNAAFLGLKLVCDDLITTTDEKNIEHYEILLDVQSACKTAVEILNDFLCFDKLESGILEIHKLEVSVIPFITNCVSMFSSQAKEAGVDISYTASTPNTTPFSNNNSSEQHLSLMEFGLGQGQLLESDKVMIDKFKMDQVLRNLISNALKFTPRGGSVTISASFVPDDDRDVLQCSTSIKDDWYKDKGSPKSHPSHAFSFPFKFIFPYPCGGSPRIFVSTSTETNNEAPQNNVISLRSAPDDATHDDFVSPMIVTPTRYRLKNPYPSSMFEDINPANGWASSGESIKAKLPKLDRKVRHTRNSHLKNDTICNPGLGPSDGMHKAVAGKLRLSVTDTGCGISNANQVRLFKEIVQFNPELLQAGGGSGLGLWITSSIVQMHGGTIEVYSAGTGKGSTFTMEIDMHRWVNRAPSPDPSPSISLRPHHIANNSHSERQLRLCTSSFTVRLHDSIDTGSALPALSQGSRHDDDCPSAVVEPKSLLAENAMERGDCNFERSITAVSSKHDSLKQEVVYDVLIVDDSALNRKLLSKVLHGSGLLCEEASDGLCAIAKVKSKMASKSGNYDVILMDFVMPNMDGPAATRAIRTLGYSGPILGLTGNASSSDTEYFRDHGANAVLAKPFDLLMFKELLSITKESIITQVVATSSI